jgi:hypothetical protein
VAEDDAAGTRPAPARVVKDMTITHAEFFRTLQPLLPAGRHESSAEGATIQLDDGRVEIRLGPEGARPLGNFRLPRTLVELRFEGCSPDTVAEFIARFDLRFRRGGG